ncbi:NLR family CARD domain-containing protein 4-like isoform X2 [Stylophora pistillata]|uniref:NLR family CARD domain-containing protein 4-like isoform X2 n=1 Tax=Stylophora pistillata TaxID=50429 RepID=UPI000C0473A4|nr:NLR family CARD domain-containing protein 4-like isoform X2 [Stylophora pistillata]
MDNLSQLALQSQTVCGAIHFLLFLISWPTIIGLLRDLLDKDRLTFNCDPKPSDFVKQLCYGDYISTVSPLLVPLDFAYITVSIQGFFWMAFILYGVLARRQIKMQQDSERKESLGKRFTRIFLFHVCIQIVVLMAMMVVFCVIQTINFPEVYTCSRRNSTKIPANQIKNITCNDLHHKQKSKLNVGIIAIMAISIILCVVAITHLFCTRKHFLKQLLGDPEGDNTEDTSENNQGSIVSPGEDFEMLPAEDISAGEESCKQDDRSENKRRRLPEPLNVENCQEQLKSYYRTFSKVKIVPWDDSSSIQIDEIYTPLRWVRDHRKPSGVRQEVLEDYTDMFKGNPTRILVYGRPGIGKSTFCKKAAYDWSKSLKEIMMNFYILLLIKLRDVCDLEDIRNVLLASKLLAGDGPISVDSLYDYIINHQDKVIFILDGFDEYSCAKEHSPILEIWKGEQLRDCHVIVSTRQIKCDEIRGPSHVQFEIGGFKGWGRIESFARKFLAGEDIQEFMSYLREKDLLDMAEIPLLLVMLCLLCKEKRPEGLPTARANIYTQFIQTMVDHKDESQQPIPFQKVTSTEATEDLSNLGKVAFDALLQDRLYVRCSELADSISRTFEKLTEVGLFQIVNMTSLNREKGAYFIHKSIQEFLAAWHIKEEVLSIEGDSTLSLSKVDSLEKSFKMNEVLKFACELSTEAACTVFHHLESVGRKESLSEFKFIEPLQSIKDLPKDLQQYLKLISHSYFCCSVEKRRDLLSTFLSLTGGILPLDSNQLNIVANEQLLNCAVIPEFIFFFNDERNSEKSHRDLITVAEHTNAVVLSCSGEKKAADFLMKYSHEFLDDFFLKKEGKIVLYVCEIRREGSDDVTLFEMLRELISSTAESTQRKCLGDPLNEHDNQTASSSTEKIDSITGRTPHSFSCTRNIYVFDIEKQEMEVLVNLLPICSSLREIVIGGKPFETHDAQLTETLVSGIIFTDRLDRLELCEINLTAKPAEAIVRSLHQAPSLRVLALSGNPLGEGVNFLSQHLSYVSHLDLLELCDVKMTKEQVNDLSAAARQSNIPFDTSYHPWRQENRGHF